MFVMSSTAVEAELAYRQHKLEKAAHRALLIRNQAGADAEDQAGSRSGRHSWWRRTVLAH
jgi:hypothetical protein